MRLVFLGPPGAGKRTQAAILANQWRIPHISTDALVQGAIASQTTLGRVVQSYIAADEAVPDSMIITLIRERLRQLNSSQGWILSGFPKNLSQANALNHLMQEMNQSLDRIISFYVSADVLAQRLRQQSEQSDGWVHHQLEIYYNQTTPLLRHYRDWVTVINGDRPVEDVTHLLNNALHVVAPA